MEASESMQLGLVSPWALMTLALIIGIPLIGLSSWSRRPFIGSLKGKHVLITGGSSGIGLAIARRAVAEGALVTLVSRHVSKLSSAVDALLAEFKCGQDRIRFEAADVRDSEGIARAIRAAHKWNAIDVLVCNAGLIRGGYLGDAPVDEMKLMMSTNVEGVLNALHAAIPLLKSRSRAHHRVSIVVMGSLSSLFFMYGHSVYTATKYALRGLAESLRFELLPYDIRVSFVCPGFTDTPFLDGVDEHGEIADLVKWLHFHSREHADAPERVAAATVAAVKSGRFLVTTNVLGSVVSTLGRGCAPPDSWPVLAAESLAFLPARIAFLLADSVFKSVITRRHLRSPTQTQLRQPELAAVNTTRQGLR